MVTIGPIHPSLVFGLRGTDCRRQRSIDPQLTASQHFGINAFPAGGLLEGSLANENHILERFLGLLCEMAIVGVNVRCVVNDV